MKKIIPLIAFLFLITSCDVLLVKDISGDTIEIIAPSSGAHLTGGSASFSWEPLEQAEHYRLILVSPSFTDVSVNLADTLLYENIFKSEELLSGDYQWRLQAFNSEYKTAAQTMGFTVRTVKDITGKSVTVISPEDGSVVNSADVAFSWEELPGADRYRVVISSMEDEAGGVVADTTLTGAVFRQQFDDGDYCWRLQAFNDNYSGEPQNHLFRVKSSEDISGGRVRIISPAKDAEITTGDVVFAWEPLKGAETYRVIVAEPSFAAAKKILIDSVLTGRVVKAEIPHGDYQWKITAANKVYESLPEIFDFSVRTTEDLAGKSVTIIAPVEGAAIKTPTATFLWEPLTGAENYRVTVVSPSFDAPVSVAADETVSGTTLRIELPDGIYQWKITAMNASSHTSPQVYGFSVDTGGDISDRQVTIIAPTPGIEMGTGKVAFAWEPLRGAEKYRLTVVSPSFDNVQIFVDDMTVTETVVRMDLADGTYQWRIQGLNATSQTVPQANSFSVKTDSDIRDKNVNVISPKEGAVLTGPELTFLWDRLAGAEEYKVTIVSPSFGNIAQVVDDRSLSDNSFKIILPEGIYQWRIQAVNGNYSTTPQIYGFRVETP